MTHGRTMRLAGVVVVLAAAALTGCRGDDDDASVSLAAPDDGARVAGGVSLDMTADGIAIEEAGEAREGAGHFHVIIDDGCVAEGQLVPKDADHVHFGKGQSTGTVYLSPGEHELCLQAADGAHNALAATETVTVTAGIADETEWCAVVDELDKLFKATDESGEDFALQQVGYENARRLIAQLDAAVDVLDAGIRADITTTLATGTAITTAFIDADSLEAAFAEVENVDRTPSEAGAAHIADRCGVDIDG